MNPEPQSVICDPPSNITAGSQEVSAAIIENPNPTFSVRGQDTISSVLKLLINSIRKYVATKSN